MALKAIMLRKAIETKRSALDILLSKDKELGDREAELEQAIAEAETEDDQAAVEEAIDAFDNDFKNHE